MSSQQKAPLILIAFVWGISAVFYLIHLFTQATVPTRALISFAATNLTISWGTLYIVIGVATGIVVVLRLAQQVAGDGADAQFVLTAVLPTLVCALIGARLYHILTPPPSFAAVGLASFADYLARPEQILNFQRGGLGLYGAFLGGALGLLYATWRHDQPFLAWLDLAAVGLAGGQAIGRWSNFIAQDMIGKPTTLPWRIYVDPPFRPEPYTSFETFQPAFLYESLLMLFIFALLLRQINTQPFPKPGNIALRFLLLYGVGRFLVEWTRADVRLVASGPVSITAVVALASSFIALLLLRLRQQDDQS